MLKEEPERYENRRLLDGRVLLVVLGAVPPRDRSASLTAWSVTGSGFLRRRHRAAGLAGAAPREFRPGAEAASPPLKAVFDNHDQIGIAKRPRRAKPHVDRAGVPRSRAPDGRPLRDLEVFECLDDGTGRLLG